MKALVVFRQPDPVIGFAHCFVVVLSDGYWIKLDGGDRRLMLHVVGGQDHDMAGYYRDAGYVVVECEAGRPVRAPLVRANCVGLVKAALGLRAPFCWTPGQLYRRLA